MGLFFWLFGLHTACGVVFLSQGEPGAMGLPGLEGLPGAKVSKYWSSGESHLPWPKKITYWGKVPSRHFVPGIEEILGTEFPAQKENVYKNDAQNRNWG